MGDLLDEILSEISSEEKLKEKERSRIRNAKRWEREVAAKIKLATSIGELLAKSPRDHSGKCIFCNSVVMKRHLKGCTWLEAYIEYSAYKNRYLS